MKGQGYKYNLVLIHINQNIVVQRILGYYDATSNAKIINYNHILKFICLLNKI